MTLDSKQLLGNLIKELEECQKGKTLTVNSLGLQFLKGALILLYNTEEDMLIFFFPAFMTMMEGYEMSKQLLGEKDHSLFSEKILKELEKFSIKGQA